MIQQPKVRDSSFLRSLINDLFIVYVLMQHNMFWRVSLNCCMTLAIDKVSSERGNNDFFPTLLLSVNASTYSSNWLEELYALRTLMDGNLGSVLHSGVVHMH